MPQLRLLTGFILAMLFSVVVFAQNPSSANYSIDTVRWENLRGGPLWLSNEPQPQLDNDSGFHEVKLSPGDKLVLQVPSGSAIRVSSRYGQISANDLRAFVSNGDALYIDTQWYESSDSRSLVLREERGERLLQIERPVYADKPLHFILFLSINVTHDALSSRREPVDFDGDVVELKRDDDVKGQPFWPIDEGQELSFNVKGPARLHLQSRLRYSAGTEKLQRLMKIETRVDGTSVESTPYFMDLERRDILYIDGCAAVTGSLQGHIYDVPQGNHVVSFIPEFPIYARVNLTDNDEFLFPKLNRLSIPLDDGDAGYQGRKAQQDIVRDIDSIALDKTYRDSGLAAAAKAREYAERNSNNSEIVSLSRHLAGRNTLYRNVVPRNISNQEITLAWPKTTRLIDIERAGNPTVVDSDHQEAMLRNLGQAQFTRINKKSVNEYVIPRRQYPTLLRLLVKQSTKNDPIRFRVQFNSEDAREIRLTPSAIAPMDRYIPTVPHAGVVTAQLQQHNYHARPNTNYFIDGNRSGDIVDVAAVELNLPPNIERVTIFDADDNLDVSVQYRVSKTYRIDEAEQLEIFKRIGEQELFAQFIEYIVNPAGKLDVAQYDDKAKLESHWTPLRRLLHTRARRYEQTIAGVTDWELFIRSGKSPQDFANVANNARRNETNKNWLQALEHWAAGRHDNNENNRYQALVGQALALETLGESFLSERLLRSIYYHEDGASHQGQAFKLLLERAQDTSLKTSLLAAAAVHHPDVNIFVRLIDVLIENGEYQLALDLGLVIPEQQRPVENLLRAAYVQQDWQILEYLLSSVADTKIASYWRGYQAQYQGNFEAAIQHWTKAGQRGSRLINFLRSGIAIHDILGVDNKAIDAWQRWQLEHPGQHRWSRDESIITQSAGAVTTYAVERDLYGRMYRSTPQQPGVIKVHGPTRLRISARLEYSGQAQELIDDWLLISDGGETRRIAINSDVSVPGFRIVDSDEVKMGGLTRFELDVSPGEHEIRISALNTPLFFNVQVRRPELPLSVLPPITTNAVASFTETRKTISHTELNRIQFVQNCGLVSATDLMQSRQEQTDISESRKMVNQWLATPRGGSLWSQTTPQQEVVKQLNDIVWQAEQNKERWSEYLARGEQLFQQNLTNKELNPLISRLRRITTAKWFTLTNIEQDAGVHIAEISGWQPESPVLRVRKALMGPVWNEERVVTGGNQLGLSFVNTGATSLDLSLTSMDIAFLPRYPMTITYGINESSGNSANLSPQTPKRDVNVAIPSGSHNLRIGIDQPYANQYVKVGIKQQGRALADPSSRLYHVATNEIPVQFSVKGPAWLRIDENRSGQTVYRYAFVQPGWQRMVLKPTAGNAESLYRIHQRIPGGIRTTVPAITETELNEIPQAPLELVSSTGEPVVNVGDNIDSVKKGTLSAFGSINSRRNFDEDIDEADDKDDFFEARGEYRWFNEDETRHQKSALLGRQRSDGGSTLGASHRIVLDNEVWPYRLQFNGSVFGQDIESASSSFETSVNLSASASRTFRINADSDIIPRLRVFWRSLSLDNEPVTSDQIDQDVFTQYKADHESGLALSGLYLNRPWDDAQWILGAGMTTNEGLNPGDVEYYQLRTGWRQLVGPGVLDGEFRVRRYLDDDDRLESATRPNLRVKLDLEKWRFDQSRWQLSFLFNRDFDSQDNSVRFELGRAFSGNRGFRDFRLQETRFRRLREERYRQLYQ